jgi:hypothetical protein
VLSTRLLFVDVQDHNSALAVAAKAALGPIGMVRKGRSRTWFADRDYMLGIVEFQPSSWSKGTYLNVSLMWLWQPIDHVIFEVEPRRVGQFVSFESSEDIPADAAQVASDARAAMCALLDKFDGLAAVVEHLQTSPRAGSARFLGHLGTAYALLGDLVRARAALDAALVAREGARSNAWNALSYLVEARAAADEESSFQQWVGRTLAGTRAALKLPTKPDVLRAMLG